MWFVVKRKTPQLVRSSPLKGNDRGVKEKAGARDWRGVRSRAGLVRELLFVFIRHPLAATGQKVEASRENAGPSLVCSPTIFV